jgi:hypothetical protein
VAKAKDMMSNLGVDVEMATEKMEPDAWAKATLRDVGNTIGGKEIAKGMRYVGSIGFHLYIDSAAVQKNSYSVSTITQLAIDDDISEAMVALAMNNGTLQVQRYFNPNKKTGKRNDKR